MTEHPRSRVSKSDIPPHVKSYKATVDKLQGSDFPYETTAGIVGPIAAEVARILSDPEELALTTAVAIFSKAFLQTLGERVADGAANIPKQLNDLLRDRKHREGVAETTVGAGDEVAASIVVTADLPDEARLALLDLDVTADELRGRVLCWDTASQVWTARQD